MARKNGIKWLIFVIFEKLTPNLTCFSLQIPEKSEVRASLVSVLSQFFQVRNVKVLTDFLEQKPSQNLNLRQLYWSFLTFKAHKNVNLGRLLCIFQQFFKLGFYFGQKKKEKNLFFLVFWGLFLKGILFSLRSSCS